MKPKKRLCLSLCVLLILCVFPGCPKKNDENLSVDEENDDTVKEISTSRENFDNGSWAEYAKDVNGNLLKIIWYNADGSIDLWIENEYDENGDLAKKIRYK